MGIGDWGLGPIPNPQSPIPNPQSPIPNPHLNIFYIFIFNIIINYYKNKILVRLNFNFNLKIIFLTGINFQKFNKIKFKYEKKEEY